MSGVAGDRAKAGPASSGGGGHKPEHLQGLDLLPPAPFQGLIDGQQERPRRDQVSDQLPGSTRLTARDDQEARLRIWWYRAKSPRP